MEAILHCIFENYISKSSSDHWKVIVDALGGEEHLKSKIGLRYILSSMDSITLFFKNDLSKPNRIEVIQINGDKYKVIFRTVENYVYYEHSVFEEVDLKNIPSLFERETKLRLSSR